MAKEWSLGKFASPENPYGFYFPGESGHIKGRNRSQGVSTEVSSLYFMDNWINARRTDVETKTGDRRIIAKRFLLKPNGEIQNPNPNYDLVSIYTNRYVYGDFLTLRAVDNQVSTRLVMNRRQHRDDYQFHADYGPTTVGSNGATPLVSAEFAIVPTRLEVDRWEFPIELSGPVNYLEVDNYIAERGMEKNLDDIKLILTNPDNQEIVKCVNTTESVNFTEDDLDMHIWGAEVSWETEFGKRDSRRSQERNEILAKKKVADVMGATSRAVETITGTDLTRQELEVVSKWLGVGVAHEDNNLVYDINDSESLVRVANRYLAGVLGDFYRAVAYGRSRAIRFDQDVDSQVWKILTKIGEDKDFQEVDERFLDFSVSQEGIDYTLARTDLTRTAEERLVDAIFGFKHDPVDFLRLTVDGLRRPYREAIYSIPMTINQAQLHNTGTGSKVSGWENALLSFPRRIELVE